MNTESGQVPFDYSQQIVEVTFKAEQIDAIIKTDISHKEYAAAFKNGYIKGLKLGWLEVYCVPEQGCRTVILFPSRDIVTLVLGRLGN